MQKLSLLWFTWILLQFFLETNNVSNIHKEEKTRKRYRQIHVNEDEMFI